MKWGASSQARTRGLRLLAALAALPVVMLLASPSTVQFDSVETYTNGFQLGDRNMLALKQVRSMDRGGYLASAEGQSFIVDAREDIGLFVYLADVGLIRNLLGLDPISPREMYLAQGRVAALSVALLILLGAAPSTVLMVTLLIAFFVPSHINLDGSRAWPQIIAVGLSLAMLQRACGSLAEAPLTTRGLPGLFALAVWGGLLGRFRSEAAYMVLLPFGALLAMNLFALIFSTARQGRRALGSWQDFALDHGPALRGAVVSGVVVLGVWAASFVFYVNIALFERIDGLAHQPEIGEHLFWHPLHVGLGVLTHDQENIAWNDNAGRIEAERTNGFFGDFDGDSERAQKQRYLEIATRNTPYFLSVYHQKARLLFGAGRSGPGPLEPMVIVVALLAVLLAVSRSRGYGPLTGPAFSLCALTLVMAGAAPGLIASPRYAIAMPAAQAGVILFGVAMLIRTARSPSEPLRRHVDHLQTLEQCSIAFAVLVAALAMAALVRSSAIHSHREDLTRSLAAGDIGLPELFDQYPADAVLAFNQLSRRARRSFARPPEEGSPAFAKGVRRSVPNADPKVVRSWRTAESLYILLHIEKAVGRAHAIPIRLEYHESDETVDPHGLAAAMSTENDLLTIPRQIGAGHWLFALRAPMRTVKNCVIGPMLPYSDKLYTKPLSTLR